MGTGCDSVSVSPLPPSLALPVSPRSGWDCRGVCATFFDRGAWGPHGAHAPLCTPQQECHQAKGR